jgi:hypothetical protein
MREWVGGERIEPRSLCFMWESCSIEVDREMDNRGVLSP